MLTELQLNALRECCHNDADFRQVLSIVEAALTSNAESDSALYKTLYAREKQLQMALEGANIALWDWRQDTGEAINVHWAEVLGYEADEFLVKYPKWRVLVHPNDLKKLQDGLRDYLDGKTDHYQCEYRVKNKAGEWRWFLSQGGTVERDEHGKSKRVIGTRTDITRRKLAEIELNESHHRYQSLFEGANDAILILAGATIIECNQIATRYFGRSRDEIIGLSPYVLSPTYQPNGLTSEEYALYLIQQALNGKEQLFEWRHTRKDGTEFDCEVSLSKIVLSNEVCVQAIVRDITDRKRVNSELVKSEYRFRNLFDHSPIAMIEMDASGVAQYSEFLNDLNFAGDRTEGKYPESHIHEVIARTRCININRAAIQLFQIQNVERFPTVLPFEISPSISNLLFDCLRLVYKEPTNFTKDITLTLTDTNKQLDLQVSVSFMGSWQFIFAFEEISVRKQAESKLRLSEEKYANAFHLSPDMMLIASLEDHSILDANHQFLTRSGYVPADFSQLLFENFLTIQNEVEFATILKDSTNKKAFQDLPITLLSKDQSVSSYSLRWTKLRIGSQPCILFILCDPSVSYQKVATDLTEARNRFEQIIEYNPMVAVQGFDPEGIIQHWNKASERLYGFTKEAVIGNTIQSTILSDQDSIVSFNTSIKQVWESGNPSTPQQWQTVNANGETQWVYSSMFPIITNGKVSEIICLDIDITDLKSAEARVHETKQLYEVATKAGRIGIWEVKPDTQSVFVDSSILDLLGRTESEFNNTLECWYSWMHEDDRLQSLEITANAYREAASSFSIVQRMYHKNGDIRYLLVNAQIQRTDSHHVRYVGTCSDITELMQIQNQLSEEKERLAVTLRSIGDAVITTNSDGTITMLNLIAEKLTGWKQSEAIGKHLGEVFAVVHAETREPLPDPVSEVLRTQQIVELSTQTLLLSKHGEERIIADSGAPICDANNKVIGVVLVFRDISAEISHQQDLQRSAKLESLSILAGGIAHDFNNLLTGVVGSLSFLRMFPDAREESAKLLVEAEKSALRAKDLTKQLLTFAKGGTPVRETKNIQEIIRDTVQFALRGSKSKHIIEFADDLLPVDIDVGQIGQVFQNLTINADQAMPNGGTIRITAANVDRNHHDLPPSLTEAKYIKIEFTDSGTGISPEHLSRIFDPYFTTKATGSGLGLATTFSIIQHHHGQISVSSQREGGTTFTLYIPASVSTSESNQSPATETAKMAGSGRILVLDDDEIVRSLLSRVLSHLGYDATLTEEGSETIKAYQNAIHEGKPYQLVIMDLTIPGGMGGLEALKRLREIDPKVRAIVSSGYTTDPVMANYKDHGFIAVASKPYKVNEMGELIQRAIREK